LGVGCGRKRVRRGRACFAFWFGGGESGDERGADSDSSSDLVSVPDASMTKHENVLLDFFLEDLGVRLRVALSEGDMGMANALQEKLTEVEDAVRKRNELQEANAATGGGAPSSEGGGMGGAGGRGGGGPPRSRTLQAEALEEMRRDMERAVVEERYSDAARLRDQVKELEAGFRAYSDYAVSLGDLVEHRVYGYGGVVVGMEPACKETKQWADASGVSDSPRGVHQPFYIVLVDSRDAGDDPPQVAYCPEDWLVVRDRRAEELARLQVSLGGDVEDQYAAQGGRSRRAEQRRATFSVEHPYLYKLFYGQSHEGVYLPTRRLKALYGAIHDK